MEAIKGNELQSKLLFLICHSLGRSYKAFQVLLQHNVSLTELMAVNRTYLHLAALEGADEILEILVSSGIDIEARVWLYQFLLENAIEFRML